VELAGLAQSQRRQRVGGRDLLSAGAKALQHPRRRPAGGSDSCGGTSREQVPPVQRQVWRPATAVQDTESSLP
jgi:hypothetical protein